MISRKRLEDAGLILLLAAIVLALQLYSGAYTSDFSADDDEAGHAVSSLMVHDYIVHGLRTNPMAYAQQFYIHYPKVAIGHWPPLFYGGEAGWMLLAGRTRIAMIAFEALLAIGLLVGVFWWVRRDLGIGPALLAAIALIVPEFMQTSIATVAPNLALAFLAFWAAAVLGRYLDFGKRRDAVLFVVFAIVAVGVHGRGAMVALLPLALLLTGRFEWTRFRAAALMVALTFVAVAPRLLHQARLPTISGVPRLVGNYLYRSGTTMGWPILILAITGGVTICRRTGEPRRWLAMAGLALSGWLFHSLVDANWGDYYLATAAPAVAILAGAGFNFCWRAAGSRWLQFALLVTVCAGITWSALPLFQKPDLGYHRLPTLPGAIDLIAGSATYEGAFVGEMALRDPGLNRIVLRGSKVLSSSDWNGAHYLIRFSSIAKVLQFLDRARVDRVWIERASPVPHIAQLQSALRSEPGHWRETNAPGQPDGIVMFDRVSSLPPGEPSIQIDMSHNFLRKTIELTP